ncbi:MAG: efflux RND transporter periplasmic adaptor subunit [Cellvibrionaceae bacterium]
MQDSLLHSWFERCCDQLPDLRSAVLVNAQGIHFARGDTHSSENLHNLETIAKLALAQGAALTSVGPCDGGGESVTVASALGEFYQNYAVALQLDASIGQHQKLQATLAAMILWLHWAADQQAGQETKEELLPNWLSNLFAQQPHCNLQGLLSSIEKNCSARSVWFLVSENGRWKVKAISGDRSFTAQSPAVVEMLQEVDRADNASDSKDYCAQLDGNIVSEADRYFCSATLEAPSESIVRRPDAARFRLVMTCHAEQEAEEALSKVLSVKMPLWYLLQQYSPSQNALGVDRYLSKFKLGAVTKPVSIAAVAILLLLLLMMMPVNHTIRAEAVIEGAVHQAVVAPFEGYIETSNARAGDQVTAGQVLASLEDRELQLELQGLRTRLRELDRTYRQALAQLKHAKSQIIQAQMAQVSADVDLLEDRSERATLKSPMAGFVISGDLSRALGSPVERGQILFEVAPLENYRARLSVHQQDIQFLSQALQGRITLLALPSEKLKFSVGNIVPVFESSQSDSAFQVEGLLGESPKALRPGMKGIAKIDVGKRALGWVLFHDLIEWWQLKLWAWLP